jgi:VWFA-related protein
MRGNRPSPSCSCIGVFLACAAPGLAQAQGAVFHGDANLQSIGVQVTDRGNRDMRGLTASDFTILEDSRPQKIAFFGTEEDPITVAILLDTSPSMESGQKLARARALLAPLIRGNLPEDEIFLVPFTDRIGTFQQLSAEQRANPPAVRRDSFTGGTSLYDALATALCHLRTAKNSRQAMVVITDGADQLSRLRLEELIRLAQSSRPQIFMIGFFDANEAGLFRSSGKTVSLVSGHEIDNPIRVFARIARESGAESFFPASDSDLKNALNRILGILRAQYTLAYYPLGYSAKDASRVRRIQVRVNRKDAVVAAQRAAGSEASAENSVHFEAGGCSVSPRDHPYPWEAFVTGWDPYSAPPLQNVRYHETFTDPQSGWPDRDGSRYRNGASALRCRHRSLDHCG